MDAYIYILGVLEGTIVWLSGLDFKIEIIKCCALMMFTGNQFLYWLNYDMNFELCNARG